MSQKTFTLTNDATGESFTYPVIESTRGPAGFDMRSFYRDTGHFSFDPGFTSTAGCPTNGKRPNTTWSSATAVSCPKGW
ncbi:hypothetical protein [Hydrogenimonas sp.]